MKKKSTMSFVKKITFLSSLFFMSSLSFAQMEGMNFLADALKEVENKNFQKALVSINQAAKMDPKNGMIYDIKGRIELELKKSDDACKSFSDGIYFKNLSSAQQYVEHCLKYDPKIDLKDYKSGVFSLNMLFAPKNVEVFFTREGNIQTEFFEGKNYKGEIEWINAGEYILTPISEDGKTEKKSKFSIRAIRASENDYLYIKLGEKKEETQFGIVKKMGK